MLRRLTLALSCAYFAHPAAAGSQTADAERGALLYETHCISCHSTEIHWRDKRRATDWDSLQSEVRRWQDNAALDWREEDIVEVTRYLNTRYYHYPAPQ